MTDVVERWGRLDDKLVIQRSQDVQPVLDENAALRSAGMDNFGKDNWCVGRIPMLVLEGWMKEAGKRWDDHEAMREVIRRKLLDGDFAKFRVHEGTF